MRRHTYWLLLVMVVASATLQVATEGSGIRLAIVMLQAATLVVALRTAGARPWVAHVGGGLATAAAVAAALVLAFTGDVPPGAAAIVNGLLVALAPPVIGAGVVRELMTERSVSLRTLSGVLCIYLLIGMFFSFLYGAVGELGSEHFFLQVAEPTRSDYLYFSYITQATVGYGDLTAAHDVGRMLAVMEALIGQVYLVTVVALIVGNLGQRTHEWARR